MFDNSLPIFIEGESKATDDKCIMLYKNKDSFTGSVVNGLKSNGKMIYANNEIYEGEWLNDKRHGKGKMTYLDGKDPIIADWINDYVIYDSKFTDKTGNKYAG